MGKKKAKVKLRRRVLIKGTVEEFVLLGDFLFSFDFGIVGFKGFKELASGQERASDLVIEVVPEVDNRKNERLPGWFKIRKDRALVVLNGATDEQLAKFAASLRKEWFPTHEELRERESERRRSILEKMLRSLEPEILKYRLSVDKLAADHAPFKTD